MESIAEIKEKLAAAAASEREALLIFYAADGRKGVQALLASYAKKQAAYAEELQRLSRLCVYEAEGYAAGDTYIAGVDEVGRGPLAGPVVAAAVVLPRDCRILGINDSKKLSAQKREALYEEICEKAVSYAFGVVSPQAIDEINILQATFRAMREAVAGLSVIPDRILVDGNRPIPGFSVPQRAIVQGDGKSMSIAAASIIAKVVRDDMMREYEDVYPGYGFAQNKGYGAAVHIAALQSQGPCPIHRRSFLHHILGGAYGE